MVAILRIARDRASSLALDVVAAVVLHLQGFGPLAGIVIIVACLTINQTAYLPGSGSSTAAQFRNRPITVQANVAMKVLATRISRNSGPHLRQ